MQSISIYIIKMYAFFGTYYAPKLLPLAPANTRSQMPPTRRKYGTKLSEKKVQTSNTMECMSAIDQCLYN